MVTVCVEDATVEVAVKVAEVDPVATVTEEGLVRYELLSESVTTAPPLGAALFKVTVHRVLEPEEKLEGLHPTVDSIGQHLTVTVVVLELRL